MLHCLSHCQQHLLSSFGTSSSICARFCHSWSCSLQETHMNGLAGAKFWQQLLLTLQLATQQSLVGIQSVAAIDCCCCCCVPRLRHTHSMTYVVAAQWHGRVRVADVWWSAVYWREVWGQAGRVGEGGGHWVQIVCLMLNSDFLLYGMVVNIRASDLHTMRGWVTGTLLKLAHGCRATSHNAYRPLATPKP